MSRLFAILILVCIQASAWGQVDRYVSARAGHGFFIPHRQSLPQLLRGHTSSIALEYRLGLDGESDWHHSYGHLEKGIAFLLVDMGNREELGLVYTIYPFVDIPLSRQAQERRMLALRLGVGPAWVDRQYDREGNFYNLAIGSKVNYSIVLGLGYRKRIADLDLYAGLSMTHASNGAIELPNLGVNMVTADVGLSYRIAKAEDWKRASERTFDPFRHVSLILSGSIRDGNSFTDTKYGIAEIRARYAKRISSKSALLLGTDLIHHAQTYKRPEVNERFGLNTIQAGLNAGITLEFGSSKLYLQQGVYLARGFQKQGMLYSRVGGVWECSERLYFDLGLKTHFAKADYLALGIGYKIKEYSKD